MAMMDPSDEELRDALAADERELSVVISSATLPDMPITRSMSARSSSVRPAIPPTR